MKVFRFEARIEAGRGGGAFVRFPFDVQMHFATRGRVEVKASFDEMSYRGSLAPMGGGVHILGLRKDLRAAIGKDIGDRVRVVVERDTDERTVVLPPVLASALRARRVRKRFDALSFTRRREMAQAVEQAKREDTRRRRVERIVDELTVDATRRAPGKRPGATKK